MIGLALLLCPLSAPLQAGPHVVQNHQSPPEVFASLTFVEARAQASEDGKLLVLDAMTSWCGPCKQMDVSTWIDPALVRWMRAHTVPIQLDMDDHEALQRDLDITAFPTIVVFDADGEADRLIGYRGAKAIGDWLKLVRSGSTELERMVAEIDGIEWKNTVESLRLRRSYAQELIYLKGYKPALKLLLEAWAAAPIVDDSRPALRHLLRDLASADRDSAAAIQRLRQTTLDGVPAAALAPESPKLRDWIALSIALNDLRGLDAWVLGQNARNAAATVRHFGNELYPVLLNARQWRSAGIALTHPLQRFEKSGAALAVFDAPPTPEKGQEFMAMPMIGAGARRSADSGETNVLIRAQFRWDVSCAYGSLLAAGRTDEAIALADVALRYEDSAKTWIALVSRALEADPTATRRMTHMRWLDEALAVPTDASK